MPRIRGAAVLEFLIFASVLVLFLLAAGAYRMYQQVLLQPLPLAAEDFIEVQAGQGFRQINREFVARGWVRHPWLVEAQVRQRGIAHRLQVGEYRVIPGSTLLDLLEAMQAGRVVQHRLTIIEGWRLEQMLEALRKHPELQPLPEDWEERQWWQALGGTAGDMGEMAPEGWFLPDTYSFPRGTSALDILRAAHRAMQEELATLWEQRAEGLPLQSPYELLILASIVEKETGATQEREQIAGVFINRLRQNMRLQTDPTLLYAQPLGTQRLTRAELRRDHDYNTYTRAGLPPTPIALPGRAALRAVAHPASTKALFFVSRKDGTHAFSDTYAQHREAVIQYQLGGDASRYGR